MIKVIRTVFLACALLLPVLSGQGQAFKSTPDGGAAIEHAAGTVSEPQMNPLHAIVSPGSGSQKWASSVRPAFSREHYGEDIRRIKREKEKERQGVEAASEEPASAAAFTPKIGVNFEANWSVAGTPPDNHMAISNAGFIVTVNNDGIEYYNAAGTFLYFDFWSDFFNDNTLTGTLYDPRVIYDSGSDRFVLVVLHGSTANSSKVVVCFSQSNDPDKNGWWVYKLTGNPLNNGTWFDFPSLGVSNNEIYVTGNLFTNSGNFNQSIIYQIPKAAGYAGSNLSWQFWKDLSSAPYAAFTLVPVSHGQQGNYGPGIFFVSSNAGGETRIRLWDLTNDMGQDPELKSYTVVTAAYSPSADAQQKGSQDKLDNGDCRIQSAFYVNNMIHFVMHSDVGSGFNGIHYNRLTVNTTTNVSSTFGLPGTADYSYPTVASYATNNSDRSVMVGFLAVSSTEYPQVRVVNCDNMMTWSASTLVKAGETHVNIITGDERWGDYSGVSRRHNSPGSRIWISGCYGANVTNPNFPNTYKTWVAEVYADGGVEVDPGPGATATKVFPNPWYDLIQLLFTADGSREHRIELFDEEGRRVKLLYADTPRAGENRLTFNKEALPSGTYFIRIRAGSEIIKNEKISMVH